MKGVQEWILPVPGVPDHGLPVADDEQPVCPVSSARQAVAQDRHQAAGPPIAAVAEDPGNWSFSCSSSVSGGASAWHHGSRVKSGS